VDAKRFFIALVPAASRVVLTVTTLLVKGTRLLLLVALLC